MRQSKARKTIRGIAGVVGGAMLAGGVAWASASGPPADVVNRPGGAGTCANATCHTGVGNPALQHPNLTLAGLAKRFTSSPDFKPQYVPGQTSTMTLTHVQTGVRRFGFELGVFDSATSSLNAGTLVRTDTTNTQLDTGTGRAYIKHTAAGTCRSSGLCTCSNTTTSCDGSKSWTFNWTAPSSAMAVTFYTCSNATNNNCCNTGDTIRCNQWSVLTENLPDIRVAEAEGGGAQLTWTSVAGVSAFSVWSHVTPDFDDVSVQAPVLVTTSGTSGIVVPDCGQPTCYYLVE